MPVLMVMDLTTRNEHGVAGPDLMWIAVEGRGERAFQPLDRLIHIAVEMWGRHAGLRWDGEFEHHQVARTLGLINQEPKPEISDTNDRIVERYHSQPPACKVVFCNNK